MHTPLSIIANDRKTCRLNLVVTNSATSKTSLPQTDPISLDPVFQSFTVGAIHSTKISGVYILLAFK